MDVMFMNSENSKTSKPHVSILYNEVKKTLLCQFLVFNTHGKT